jgi:hypothetical protein
VTFTFDLGQALGGLIDFQPPTILMCCCFALAVRLHLPDIPKQTVTLVFGPVASLVPHVYSDGPSESPHRYPDGSLCMWYPGDPAQQRWTRNDGPSALLGHIVAHLLREEWWRCTGEWPGAEAGHLPVALLAT